jgi:hypothetical protein
MQPSEAHEFAKRWLAAWNSHDLEAILAHFAENVLFTSPVAAALIDGSGGVIQGKQALRAYWSEGLRLVPDLHFEVLDVYVGVSTVVINYRNQGGGLVNEVLIFDGANIVQGHGTYQGGETNPAGVQG